MTTLRHLRHPTRIFYMHPVEGIVRAAGTALPSLPRVHTRSYACVSDALLEERTRLFLLTPMKVAHESQLYHEPCHYLSLTAFTPRLIEGRRVLRRQGFDLWGEARSALQRCQGCARLSYAVVQDLLDLTIDEHERHQLCLYLERVFEERVRRGQAEQLAPLAGSLEARVVGEAHRRSILDRFDAHLEDARLARREGQAFTWCEGALGFALREEQRRHITQHPVARDFEPRAAASILGFHSSPPAICPVRWKRRSYTEMMHTPHDQTSTSYGLRLVFLLGPRVNATHSLMD